MSNKKAFEMQFNWLFVLIAGAAIILFFTAIVVKQKSSSESTARTTILKSIESIISSAGVSTDTTTLEDIPNSNIEIDCDKVSIGGVAKQYQTLILFAPATIKGNSLITQTLTFIVPYRSTNLLYMTSPGLRYILIGDNNIAREINRSLPMELKKEVYKIVPAVRNGNNYKVRFIVFEDIDVTGIDISALQKMNDNSVTAIKVIGDEKKGDIEFYQKDNDAFQMKGTSSYIGKSSLIGAVYVDTLELYRCNMQNTFTRLNVVTNVYIERTRKLKESMAGNIKCTEIYDKASSSLNIISRESLDFLRSDIDKLREAADSLASANNEAQVYSCPLVY